MTIQFPSAEAFQIEVDHFQARAEHARGKSLEALQSAQQEILYPESLVVPMMNSFKYSLRAKLFAEIASLIEEMKAAPDHRATMLKNFRERWFQDRVLWTGWAALGSWGPEVRVEGAWRLAVLDEVENLLNNALNRINK